MQFKFKIQPYQTEAARAVTDVFAGQPNSGASLYLRDLGRAVGGDGTEALPGFETQVQASEGYANAPIALGSATLLENIHRAEENGVNPAAIKRFKAEAYFARACKYAELLFFFGACCWPRPGKP